MRRIFFILLFVLSAIMGWSQESYTALKVTGDNVPVIEGTIDAIWNAVEIVPLAKVPDNSNITEPNPDASDYYAEFGMLWNDDGMFFIFRVTDEKIVIEDDDPTLDVVPADKWWTDDNINLLFSKDLVNTTFTQWEFAWQPGINQEEKLSSDDWLNAAKIDISLVQSAWYQDGTTWTLETFINWQSFNDGVVSITPDQVIYLEARARDDDDGGTWESMFQWSTTNYEIESTGEGFGSVTLSSQEVQPVSGISVISDVNDEVSVYPNPFHQITNLMLNLDQPGRVVVELYSFDGRKLTTLLDEFRSEGKQVMLLNMRNYNKGSYLLKLNTVNGSRVIKLL
ncbi:MAG: T9SS type A sorting domain-containing protein [Bacteroidales bacterium]|nr:T9SS type A sorting domain-containing protein [Bacteroidales bacterium]